MAPPRLLTQPELAREAEVPIEYVDELVAAGVLDPDTDRRFEATDVSRVRLARALRDGGITLDDIGWAAQTNQLPISRVARFSSAIEAVAGVRELMTEIAQTGLPAAHAAIAVGPFVVREGDVYGNTVNLASRIAAHAQPGELLIPLDDARAILEPTEWTDAGEAIFKGLPDPIGLARLRVPSR